MQEERRRAIVQEIADLLPRRRMREPHMFTATDVAVQTGRRYPLVMRDLRELVEAGTLCCDTNGYDPGTGRHVTLFWRPADEPRGA